MIIFIIVLIIVPILVSVWMCVCWDIMSFCFSVIRGYLCENIHRDRHWVSSANYMFTLTTTYAIAAASAVLESNQFGANIMIFSCKT